MFRQYGFNLKLSNSVPLARTRQDVRNDACKARHWPPLVELPKASVVIIFYNEPLSTLLRNVVTVLNRSPPELLGEIILVDDHSKLDELSMLPEHLDRLSSQLPPGKVRLIHRDVHDGIVGARNRGAEEAIYPVVVVLDAHAEVLEGWLEPLLARIHGDRQRVVVPNLLGIDVNTLDLIGGGVWPPSRGSFNWRLTFTIVRADTELDILEHDVDKRASAVRSPVMPGGLFAMDREYFLKLGKYDPEIKYYGAEHVEMSFRIWMCGGSMETMPCSNIGHIYREFDRFGVDPQLGGVNIGGILDNNDARVAEIWMDEYKQLYYNYRGKPTSSLANLEPRRELRRSLQCRPFRWFLESICRDMYVPDMQPVYGTLEGDGHRCLDGLGRDQGSAGVVRCNRATSQRFSVTSQGYLQLAAHFNHQLICVRLEVMTQVPCSSAPRWELRESGELRMLDRSGLCLTRGYSGEAFQLKLQACTLSTGQKWMFGSDMSGVRSRDAAGILSGPDMDACLDNMQRHSGPPGLYGCHGGATQRWQLLPEGKIRSQFQPNDNVCLGYSPQVALAPCLPGDLDYAWEKDGQLLRAHTDRELCLSAEADAAVLQPCKGHVNQKWRFIDELH